MIDRILRDREQRYYEILSLITEYNMPVICGKINYPGNDKNTIEAKKAFQILKQILIEKFSNNIVYSKTLSGDDGSSILIVADMESLESKKIAITLELTHPLGRIFDIDVYFGDGESIGRENLGMEPRKCVLCGENARVCMRAGRHSLQEVVDKVNKMIRGCM
ncbi:holo-ACP synthase [Proteiniborus sp. DW1]|uniref:citrate lyase holo-[acyl-carrier protein] synthase n=1 Tax=Proteiniborus sp. DW1 TaxID=1889883 RepID=UPI00092E151E|nr:citrate lyase holo-[acyl-carrier protein] synthase [Proteiniborus sp. DW1]SCG83091.1 holo-ACP synthase [Proteiniborus sp. DW1]